MSKKLIPKHQLAGPINLANRRPHSRTDGDVFTNFFKWLNKQPIIKDIAHTINEFGNREAPKVLTSGQRYAIQDKAFLAWNNNDRREKTHSEHMKNYIKQETEKLKKSIPSKTNSQVAAGTALVGTGASIFGGPYGKIAGTIMSIPDIVYDWAASIDEPEKLSNHAHTASNHLDKLTKITPTKYDDYVAKFGEIIGNTDDAFSSFGIDIYGDNENNN